MEMLLHSANVVNMKIKLGDMVEINKVIQEKDVIDFANVSGDFNPIHMDEEEAANSIFGRRIVHGMLVASYISNVIGNSLPGNGTIYMSQTLKFCLPIYIDDEIKIVITVKSLDESKKNIGLDTVCCKADGSVAVTGEALVKNKNVF